MATDFVEKFKRYLKEDGKSPTTIESYAGDIAGFISYLENMGVKFQGELKRFYVTSFRNYLIESQYETATINIVYLKFAEYKKYIDVRIRVRYNVCRGDIG